MKNLLVLIFIFMSFKVTAANFDPKVAVGTPTGPKFWFYKDVQNTGLDKAFVKRTDRYNYFINSLVHTDPTIPQQLYDYINPETNGINDTDTVFFEKILMLKSLDKTEKEKLAVDRINKFLATNYRNQTLPAQLYTGKQHLPDPLYLSDLKSWTFGAVAKGDLDVLRAFLDNYNLLHIKNEEGYNLLLHAIVHNQYDIAEFLIRRGISVNEVNKYGISPLMIAARNNNIPAIKLLIKYKCKTDLKDRFGNNALAYASMNNNQDVQQYLSNITSTTKSK